MLLLQTSRFGASWVLCGSFCQHPTCSYSAMLLGWAGSLVPRQLCGVGRVVAEELWAPGWHCQHLGRCWLL